ncbi:hypothetical protein M8J76_011352 [Diaphorina citri]|nr:hypothetical protein M8J76_011352 [Diaphorina citri]
MADYIGYLVEIDCGNQTFKGIVSHVDQNNLSLINVYRNNKPYNVPEITLGPKDMKNLKILDSPDSASPPELKTLPSDASTSTVQSKPTKDIESDSAPSSSIYNITERVPESVMNNLYGASQQKQGNGYTLFKYHPEQYSKKSVGNSGGKSHYSDHISNKPNKKQSTLSAKKRHEVRNDECFNVQINNDMLNIDFDFEENLKLFDKISDKTGSKARKQLYGQGSSSSGFYETSSGLGVSRLESEGVVSSKPHNTYVSKPDLVSHVDQAVSRTDVPTGGSEKKKKNYRHDENILQGDSLCNNQVQEISILQQDVIDLDDPGYEYVTDTGLKLPCISAELKKKILSYAEDVGLGFERQNETMARAATEMALQLIGGAHRLRRDNRHQWPTVVLLAGPHRSGALSVGAARVLASHDINTLVFLTEPEVFTAPLAHELASHRLSGHPVTSNIQDLPTENIDLIISGLSSYECESYVRRDVINYINDQKVPILSIGHNVEVKYSIISVLPLSYSKCNGKLYLCNLALPNGIYKDLNIQYRSPFGAKFIIPLHQK